MNENSVLNTQKLVGLPGYEHFPTIGIVNKLDDSIVQPLEQAQRTAFIGSFSLDNYDDTDLVRPSCIRDLEVVELDAANDLVQVKFTAPGDDGDIGQAARYEIKASYEPEHLFINDDLNYKSSVVDVLPISNNTATEEHHTLLIEIVSSTFTNLAPNIAGFKENFQFRIDKFKSQKTISLKMRAVDFNENYGDWSPVLVVKLDKEVTLARSLRFYVAKPEEDDENKAAALNQEASELEFSKPKLLTDLSSTRSYSNFVFFLISLFATIGIIQILFLVVLAILDIRDRRKNDDIKPVRV